MNTLDKILFLISKNGMSELEFTQKIGVNKTTVTEWKSGKTKSFKKHIDKIASVLNVTPDFLLSDTSLNTKFSNRIKSLRLENELDERWGSSIFDSTKDDLYTWECLGIIPEEAILEKLSDFYNVPVSYLVGESDVYTEKNELPLHCSILKNMRKSRGLTRKELSRCVDMPLLSIILYETPNDISAPSLNDYIKFANYYEVSIDQLLGRESYETPDLSEKERDMLFLFNRLSLENKIKAQNYMIVLYDEESAVADEPLKKTGTDCLGK